MTTEWGTAVQETRKQGVTCSCVYITRTWTTYLVVTDWTFVYVIPPGMRSGILYVKVVEKRLTCVSLSLKFTALVPLVTWRITAPTFHRKRMQLGQINFHWIWPRFFAETTALEKSCEQYSTQGSSTAKKNLYVTLPLIFLVHVKAGNNIYHSARNDCGYKTLLFAQFLVIWENNNTCYVIFKVAPTRSGTD